jgi:hypothetical protein
VATRSSANCTKAKLSNPETVAATERIEGYRALRVVRGSVTRWFALDHGCALLRQRVETGKEVSEAHLVALTPGEPATELFAVPGDYAERPPSARAPARANCDPECQARRTARSAVLDRAHHRNRVQ